ncbi:hypothetical protein ERO13_D04G187500v2 [Gossypium hirsutum]|uniref:DUF7733 domain-containing protein n=5 Tax=Gossypium TaxID=3633 RepID=A0A1U8JXA8_GOSHI|nr:uncharacterized protein LOC105780173 isoform X1 [Gossypium raimondii]XP_016694870.1 uncharacterized protein LOC107911546 [Gossypium hirsutum]KAB2036312.1 hypothetical protein ES319_D04G216500v1 [Gossypium barbadense]TYG74973.1 hypothetical protein ES288_D04G227100v1 [Gossypium darwinii]TYI88544.1 hypothetical protein E1A91_D04G217800v1 [Gossypium mustelinum]KAG4153479.1 hypothetical protein ERO13_D04G187500v2 [Gossypium hirsutum]KJB78152.1 hypothetical protein B456_012G180900 [Gossypium ra
MSGLSLAVAPRSEPDHTIAPGEKPEHKPPRQQRQQQQQQQSGVGSIMGSLRVIELQLVVFIMVFSISGLVPLLDLVFPAIASAYIIALSRFAFPSNGHVSTASQEIFQGSKLFRLYVILGTAVGLFLPLAYVLGGFARGDNHDVRSATPHLFLLSFQILTENVIGGLSLFSPPVRALVPLLYTVRRIFVLVDWIHDVWLNKTLPVNAQLKDIVWHWLGKCLAAANLLYFSINLFFFLIPRFLPRAFERYFKERDEIRCKMSEDKRPIMANKSLATNKKDD